nr:hypothetical protein NCPCFENI_00661 [Cupriavidus sp.]
MLPERIRSLEVSIGDSQGAALMKLDLALSRMCSGLPDRNDEGYATLLPNAPSVKTLQERFMAARDEIEVELARR